MWAEMTEDLKKDFTKSYFDSKVNQMVAFAKCGVSILSNINSIIIICIILVLTLKELILDKEEEEDIGEGGMIW